MNQLPILYKRAKTGKINIWEITIENKNDQLLLVTTRGQKGGKLVKTKREIKKGKGKRNKLEQTQFIANKKWKDKQSKDYYIQDCSKIDDVIIIKPMLATKFNIKKVQFPCITQPKLDGLRGIAYVCNDKIIIESRQKKEFNNLEHIIKQLEPFFKKHPDIYLDGELYSPNLKFEEISGLCRLKETVVSLTNTKINQIEYYIYDCFQLQKSESFEKRYQLLEKQQFTNNLKLVKNKIVNNPDKQEFMKIHNEYITQGYEGLMIRNKHAFYEIDKRSNNLQKLKVFHETEYTIIGFNEGEGTFKGTIIWVCETPDGKQFNATPRGSLDYRKQLFLLGNQYIGKQITIIYQELTKDGIPRFPIAKAIRIDY